MAYNILAIRSTKDPVDELYPTIGKNGRTVTMNNGLDGTEWPQFSAQEISVWEARDDHKYHRLGGFSGAVHTIFITNYRVVILSPNFKHADAGYLMFDLPGFYLASAAVAALRTHGRALTGHILHRQVFKLSVLGAERPNDAHRIRLHIRDETEGNEREVFLQITFSKGTDAALIAQDIARRAARYWLLPLIAKELDAERIAVVRQLAEAPLLRPAVGEWRSYHFPFSVGVARNGRTPVHKFPEVTRAERLAVSGESSS